MAQNLHHCPLCGSSEHAELNVTPDRHFGIEGTYRNVRCSKCSLVFLNPMYSEAELTALYPDDYYAYRPEGPKRSGIRAKLRGLLVEDFTSRDPEFPAPGRVLDVGCGSGSFLRGMREKGWVTHGVEVSASAAKVGRDVDGLDIFCGSLQDAAFPTAFFDYVRAYHSFEHMTCPNETLDEIHRILKPTGKLFLGVPNIESLTFKIFGPHWWYLGAPLHTFNYSVTTLSALLRRHGFVPERVIHNSERFGFLGSLQIWLNRNTKRKSREGPVYNSRALMVVGTAMAKLVDLLHLGDEIEITSSKRMQTGQ